MHRSIANITLLLLALAAGAAGAQPPRSVPLEEAVETSSRDVRLPTDANGPVVFSNCGTCRLNSLRLSGSTRYFVGTDPVTLRQLNAFVAAHDPIFMLVYYRAGTSDITRIVASGKLH